MKFVADLHLHSKYSRAVSQQMVFSNMAKWARYKGINVLATGDFTHPFWLSQIKSELEPVGNGLFRLRSTPGVREGAPGHDPGVFSDSVWFLLSCEVSSIYSQGGKTRRVHNLFMFPSVDAVEEFNGVLLKRRANLRSDGRPIVGVSSRDLAEIALSCDEKALVIPAHAWTPWFSVFGSFSGFDSIEECFGDMAPYIYGIETGLSSDPAMNWQIADLDNRTILSFSDAHSLPKMGREATVFEAEEISYGSIYDAIAGKGKGKEASLEVGLGDKFIEENPNDLTPKPNRSPNLNPKPKIAFTIEFYPEEGKYHFTGHRNCNYVQTPQETREKGDNCPVCKRALTVGVMHRVGQLKTRNSKSEIRNSNGVRWVSSDNGRPPFVSMVPLHEVLAEALGIGVGTRKVQDACLNLVNNLGSEFAVLIKAEIADIAKYSNGRIAEGVAKVRNGDLVIEPGYDGKYGVVKIWRESTAEETGKIEAENQMNLFT